MKDVLDAYAQRDVERALDVWERDVDLDALEDLVFRDLLTHMVEDPRNITFCAHLLFCSKNIVSRIQDRARVRRTLIACQRPPRGVGTPRALSASATARRVVAPDFRISAMIGRTLRAARSASALTAATAASCAAPIWGLPSFTPFAFAAASADLVRPAMRARSFSASAA